jgi:hypothetical protein
MALPAMKVMQEAEDDPESPLVAVSDRSRKIFSSGKSSAAAAI